MKPTQNARPPESAENRSSRATLPKGNHNADFRTPGRPAGRHPLPVRPHAIPGPGDRQPAARHAVPGDAALFPTPGGEQTVLAVCGTTTMFPGPGGRHPPLFPRFGSPPVCQRCRHHLHLPPYLDAERTVLLAAVNRLDAQAGSVHDLNGRVQRYAAASPPTPSPCPTTISPSQDAEPPTHLTEESPGRRQRRERPGRPRGQSRA